MSPLNVTGGVLVSSENVIVMVSPSLKKSSRASGSSATMDLMNGASLIPNVPVNGGDSDVEKDDPSTASSSALSLTCKVNSPIEGQSTSKFARQLPASSMMICKVNLLSHSPV